MFHIITSSRNYSFVTHLKVERVIVAYQNCG